MAIHNEVERHIGAGHIKEIDDSAIELIMSNLQRSQYQFPIKSTVREITANGVDSVEEKRVAKLILTGKARTEDFFVEREGEVFRDSKFDPSYYDLKWLSDDDKVRITYQVGDSMKKDQVIFTDNGVGLGGRRLQKYFSLGFSTKRLSKLPLGKFGIGAKAPLSVVSDFYTMESRYNGQKFRFNIYNRTVDSIIPRFDLSTGRENSYVLFNEGTEHEYKVYWEPTTEKNGVTVYIEAKKTHKQQYIEAVKSQLLYFDNIEMTVIENDLHTVVPYKATILYEDEHIVLSDNHYYSKPHILLNKISYGYINWDELELEDISGNIGIKVAPESVEVNPSRESINWSDQTKATVLEKLGTVSEIATRFINEELKETDFWRWLKTCYSISSRYNDRSGIIGRLAKVVDIASVRPKYSQDHRIRFSQELIDFETVYVSYKTIHNKNLQKKMVDRSEVKNIGSHVNVPIFLRDNDERASNRRDKYLLTIYPNGFMLMTEPSTHWLHRGDPEKYPIIKSDKSISYAELWEYLLQSQDTLIYSEVEVPKDFTGTEEDEEDKPVETVDEVAETKVARVTEEERRKLEGKIIISTPRANSWGEGSFQDIHLRDENQRLILDENNIYKRKPFDQWKAPKNGKAYEWTSIEVPIKEINNWDAEEIYYARQNEDEMAQFVCMLTRDVHPDNKIGYGSRRSYAANRDKWTESKWYRLNKDNPQLAYVGFHTFNCQHYFDAKVMIVRSSQANQKHLRDFRPLQQFFIRIHNNKITMSNTLIQWNTARIIKDKLASAAFLYNFEQFNPKYAEMYRELTQYVDRNYREVRDQVNQGWPGLNKDNYSDLLTHLEKVQLFQEYVAGNPDDTNGIAAMAAEMFGNKELRDGMAVDPEIVDKMDQVLEFALGCGTMLNAIPHLTGYTNNLRLDGLTTNYSAGQGRTHLAIPFQLEQEIKLYLEYKGMLGYDIPLDGTDNDDAGTVTNVMVPSQKAEELADIDA